MLREEVAAADVAEVAARWTGIPVAQLLAPERAKLLALPEALHERVVGQDAAVEAIADALQRCVRRPALRACSSARASAGGALLPPINTLLNGAMSGCQDSCNG